MENDKIILGIDPGTNIMGYGLISCQGKKIFLLTMGVLKLHSLSNQALKLQKIFERTLSLIDEYHPDEVSLESPFYGKNVQAMLKLGRAQGVAMASALHRDIPITEYSPRRIKQSITGRGAASKEQVAAMLNNLLNINEHHEYLDASDGLAVAVCHSFQQGKSTKDKQYGSWKSFLNDNPDRVSG